MPPDLTLSDTPYNLASLDKNPASFAWVTAHVHDEFGAPISGQVINFAISSYTPTGNDDPSRPPHLSSATATTGADGVASVRFIPGAFNNPGPSDRDSTVVTATWTVQGISKTGSYTWTNRPFLNINANVNPKTVINGSEMDVTINVTVSGTYTPSSCYVNACPGLLCGNGKYATASSDIGYESFCR